MSGYNIEYMKEIGSEFCEQYREIHTENKKNELCLLSGRTALQFIIDDICRKRFVRKVLLPSYCCESMILPFINQGIEVQFYQANNDWMDYPYDNDADVVFLIDFFGYINPQNGKIAYHEKHAKKIIIYDSTHKIDGNLEVLNYADYSFCSYRKWFYCNFTLAVKYNGEFENSENLMINERYISLRDEAAYDKRNYLSGLTNNKERFLSEFNKAEQLLEDDYIGYAGVPVSFDCNDIISKRRENALYLTDELKNISEIKLWRNNIQVNDTPMFVPIVVNPLIRDTLRQELISKKIYCPVHWPKTSYHTDCNKLYDMELSLVCDQRYDIADMERMIRVIKGYFNG